VNLSESNTAAPLADSIRVFTFDWIASRQGSAAEFLWDLEERLGWKARYAVLESLQEMRRLASLSQAQHKFLFYTLSEEALQAALSDGAKPGGEFQSALDDLFERSRRFRTTEQFAQAVQFVAKFREYSPYNNMLVYLQNPQTTYFATASHWRKVFGRTVKEEAKGMIILAPRTPVLLVYDIADTEGPRLPEKLELFSKTTGQFDPAILERTIRNCQRDRIQIERKPMGQLRAGFATTRLRNQDCVMRILLRDALEPASAYSVLCHELAHVYLGHLGAARDAWWPYRKELSDTIAEIEVESVAHTVCQRAGIATRSAEYLSNYVVEEHNLSSISLDLVCRVSSRIEEMGRKLLPPRLKETAPF